MAEKLTRIIKEESYAYVKETYFGLSGEDPVGGEVWMWDRGRAPEGRVRVECKIKDPYSCPVIAMENRYCYARYPSDQGVVPIANEVGTMLTYCGRVGYKFMVDRLKSQAKQMGSEVV